MTSHLIFKCRTKLSLVRQFYLVILVWRQSVYVVCIYVNHVIKQARHVIFLTQRNLAYLCFSTLTFPPFLSSTMGSLLDYAKKINKYIISNKFLGAGPKHKTHCSALFMIMMIMVVIIIIIRILLQRHIRAGTWFDKMEKWTNWVTKSAL